MDRWNPAASLSPHDAAPAMRLSAFAPGVALAGAAIAIQLPLGLAFARDSYQLFLGAVVLAAIRAGAANAIVALAVSSLAKTVFLFLPGYPGHGQTALFLPRMVMFLLMGSVLVAAGGSVHVAVRRLKQDIARATLLRGLLPICASCKRIRDERGAWCEIESYISRHSDAEFSHGFCPRCAARAATEVEAMRS